MLPNAVIIDLFSLDIWQALLEKPKLQKGVSATGESFLGGLGSSIPVSESAHVPSGIVGDAKGPFQLSDVIQGEADSAVYNDHGVAAGYLFLFTKAPTCLGHSHVMMLILVTEMCCHS